MIFFVHNMTAKLARTLNIGAGKVLCTANPKITFKMSKNQLFLSYCTCLPKFGCGTTKPRKSMWPHWKINFFFCLFYTVWTSSHPKMKSGSFSISSQYNFKNEHFSNLQTSQIGNLTTTSNWLFKWCSWLAALKKFI